VSRLRAADNGLFKGFAHADRTLLDPDFNKTLLDLAANNGLMVITQSSAPCCGAGITSPGGDGHDGWSRSGRSPRRRIQSYGHGSAAHLPERGTSHTEACPVLVRAGRTEQLEDGAWVQEVDFGSAKLAFVPMLRPTPGHLSIKGPAAAPPPHSSLPAG
jgi:hypothetical protein